MSHALIGVIGGSGLYHMEALQGAQELVLETPYGKPSDAVVTGTVHGVPVAFLARHGRGHRLIPSEVPYRANIHAMRQLGVRYLLSFSAVGSMREDMRPLDMVLPNQFIDLTKRRDASFFGNGAVAHVSMAEPVCAQVAAVLTRAVDRAGLAEKIRLHQGGTYVCIEGPQFSTQAESHWYRSMRASVIGMTNMPEAKLAREAEMSYATMALATDYDCWYEGHESVTIDAILAVMGKNIANAKKTLVAAVEKIGDATPRPYAEALKNTFITSKDKIPKARLDMLKPLFGKYFNEETRS